MREQYCNRLVVVGADNKPKINDHKDKTTMAGYHGAGGAHGPGAHQRVVYHATYPTPLAPSESLSHFILLFTYTKPYTFAKRDSAYIQSR